MDFLEYITTEQAYTTYNHYFGAKNLLETLSPVFFICFRLKPWIEQLKAGASHNCEKPSHLEPES
jgi:hypothetical protein